MLRRLVVVSTALFALAFSACGGPQPNVCDSTSCANGCCTAEGQCVTGTANDACGTGGALCSACSGAQQCQASVCVAPMTTDAGSDAGMDADAGTDAGMMDMDAGMDLDGGAIVATPETWTWVDFPDSQCGNGAPTGIGINPTSRSKDLLLFLQGGGACWEKLSCFLVKSATFIETGYTSATFASDGSKNTPMFNRANMNNPVKDMSYVYVPYCTGDVHAGDAVRAYDSQDPNRLVYHKGGKNMDAFLARLKATFPDAERVFVSGSSAGAYGAQLNFPKVRATWPNAEVHVLADCGQMINPTGTRLTDWLTAWNVTVPSDCTDCTTDFPKYPAYLATKYPTSRFALLAYEQDTTLNQFFGYDLPTMRTLTLDLLTQSYDPHANAKYFLVPTTGHVMLDDLFTLVGANNVPLLTFTSQFLTNDSAWASVKQ